METIKIDCFNSEWKSLLKQSLQEGSDVNLSNFHYTVDGQFCELLAMAHNAVFSLDVALSAGYFRKRSALSGGIPFR